MLRFDRQKGRCHYCGEVLELVGRNKFQVDHFIPLSRGGANAMNNIVCACPGCNRAKGSKFPWDFRPARFDVGCGRDD
ncbi:HNH endonuclease [Deinococcus aetherius]